MYKYIAFFAVFAFLLAGCSSREAVRDKSSVSDNKPTEEMVRAALDRFVEGNMADLKGDYASAVLEYQEALALDPQPGVYFALGKDYLLLEKLPQALQYSRMAVRLDSLNIDYQNLLSEVYMRAGYNDSAAAVYEKIIALDSSDTDAYYNLAYLYEQTKPLRSLEIYKKLISITGPEWNILVRMAELNERLGRTDESVSALEEMLKLDPSNAELQKLLAELYIKSGKLDSAMHFVETMQQLFPEDINIRELKAQIFLAKDDWQSAASEYTAILENPSVPFESKMRIGSVYLGRSLQDSTMLETARKMFVQMDRDTTYWQIKMILGEIALQQKDDTTAQSYFLQVTKLASWNADAYVRLGGLYFDHKRYSDAVTVLDEAVASFPDNFVINLVLGLSYSQLNDFRSAEPYLKKAVELNPGDVTALSAYGFTLNQVKKPDEAVHYITQALKLSPENVDLIGTLGLIYNNQKNWEKCDSLYSRALSIDPANALILNNYAYSLAERGERLPDALKMVQTAIDSDPDNSSYLDTIGWVYFMMGNFQEAEKNIKKAIEIDGENATLLEHLGDVSFKLGSRTKAMELWQKALKKNADNNELKQKIEKGEL